MTDGLVEAIKAQMEADADDSYSFDRAAHSALAALKASGFAVVPVGEPASMWRNAITNTVALIDIVRRRHKIPSSNKAFAVFDCDLNGALDDWFKATRSAKPETYDDTEKVWKDFAAMIAAAGGQ